MSTPRGKPLPGNHALPLPLLAGFDHDDRPHYRGSAAGVARLPPVDRSRHDGRGAANWPAAPPRWGCALEVPAGRRISHRSRRPDCGVPPRGSPFAGAGQFPRRGARQGGLVLLPHPFVGHSDPAMLAARADLVEVFNGRAGEKANRSAAELAARLGQTGVLGVRRPPRVQPGTDRRDGGKPGPAQGLPPARRHYAGARLPAAAGDVFLSQVIKVVKTRDVRRALRYIARRAASVARRLIGIRSAPEDCTHSPKMKR